MEIKIDYYIKEKGTTGVGRIMHTVITDDDIERYVEEMFRNGEVPCPIYYDKDTAEIDVSIDQVTI